jgi:carbon-monoxide dehydrogenase medium subunit
MPEAKWTMAQVRISAGPVAPVPFRAMRTEEFLRGKHLEDAVLEQAEEILQSEAQPRTSAHRATKAYRHELLPTLLEQTLRKAIERATTGE